MKDEIDLVKVIKNNRKIVWACIAVFITILIAGIFLIRVFPTEKNYISSSEFKIINGEESINLYQGVYHKITTFDDVASVLRSNEVLVEVIRENNIDIPLKDFRQDIDIYEIGDMLFKLELIFPDKTKGEKINLSLIHAYLELIESRMDNDNKELFDIEILRHSDSREMGSRFIYKMIAVFLFGLFCVIIVVLITRVIKLVVKNKYEEAKIYLKKK